MSITVLLGAQWGDEGKGRITDALAADADIVARFNGGDNAGHTITIGSRVFKLHLLPAGIFRERCLNLIGNGVVLNPIHFLKERNEIVAAGFPVTPENLQISEAAHVILPGHIALDAAREATQGGIGTTQRGIGFAYSDKAARLGLRAGLMRDPERFAGAVYEHTQRVNRALEREYRRPPLDAQAVADQYAEAARHVAPYLANTFRTLHRALAQGRRVLAEGAQAVMLDIDHGTYPFVTSSNATIGGVLTGLGVPAQAITRVVGMAKAFCTRVGAGPFVTELDGELALRLRGTGANPWDEYGATTGRPRRVGWFDGVALRYAAQMNGLTELALTKLDILTGLDPLRICVAYAYHGAQLEDFPQDSDILAQCRPIYEELPGWQADVRSARSFDDLPAEARAYIARIEALAGVRVTMVSVGPEREQLVVR
ncbi:MAG: adenylosuccinate synthase [Chloroflexi bacterium]|jgi:adenylosuccinate synthase|uniref:Adenylosuccinate synthetase n=1 Tax=Candidatus Thermofonsia Clade 3 bacterium TaxID=2364212 RepID=A0A2M8QE27_9CHLR|nr:adenylosuccinate synthase [Candidatus Roseilinea sp. NK_OTU-006]PJF48050.1 MAG: adenylosuccinate synthase [Candidatus Thermofonsia Clade 3 bacterium]RMG63814.1 MAG: adenylosuccinate synthase [Chloroflexota bacterium]